MVFVKDFTNPVSSQSSIRPVEPLLSPSTLALPPLPNQYNYRNQGNLHIQSRRICSGDFIIELDLCNFYIYLRRMWASPQAPSPGACACACRDFITKIWIYPEIPLPSPFKTSSSCISLSERSEKASTVVAYVTVHYSVLYSSNKHMTHVSTSKR